MKLPTSLGRLLGESAARTLPTGGAAGSVEAAVEQHDGYVVTGWACDPQRPDRPLEIELLLPNGTVVATATADRLRAELAPRFRSDGRHGFLALLPVAHWAASVSVRVRGAAAPFTPAPVPPEWRAPVALVAADIVNNCNLRCPFCLVDYTHIRRLSMMPADLYRRTFALLPHVAPGHMWLSCLHEPTLHAEFLPFIEAVPESLRNRISFTTNFCKRLSDELLERLAASRIAQVRVSFDTDDPALFRELRVGGRWEVFQDNLLRFRRCLERQPVRPSLHFITMAFRDNFAAIPGLVQRGRDLYGGDTHELRFIYYFPHVANWGESHTLSLEQWRSLEAQFADEVRAERMALAGPPAGVWDEFREKCGLAAYVATETSFGGADDARGRPVPAPAEVAAHMPDEPLRLRLRWDGLIVIEQIPEQLCRLNLAELEDPGRYFAEIRQLSRAR